MRVRFPGCSFKFTYNFVMTNNITKPFDITLIWETIILSYFYTYIISIIFISNMIILIKYTNNNNSFRNLDTVTEE